MRLTVNDIKPLTLPSFEDPDLEDTPSLISCNFGSAARFIQGKFPRYILNPNSNETDPGIYEVKVTLVDDNPGPLIAIYTFNITVDPLPSLITTATHDIQHNKTYAIA